MDIENRQKLKTLIDQQILDCSKEIVRLKEAAKPVAPDNSIGRLTRMEAMQSQKIAKNNLEAAKSRLGKLKGALQRIDDDEFGECLKCGDQIPIKRLFAVPYALTCVDCA